VQVKSQPRGSFTAGEYRRLVRAARQQAGVQIPITTTARSRRAQNSVDRYAVVDHDLQLLIRFMVNSFVRPSDIKNLQHKHVTVVRGKHTYLRLNLPESKKHSAPIVTLQPAVTVYQRLLARSTALGVAQDDDYVFLPAIRDRAKALEFLGWQFKFVQQVAAVGGNKANDKTRTLYSLRHTAITFRLLYGNRVDLLTLARNARTSVEMIERFYASDLSAEMNIDLLHGTRR
jgi:integrase